MRRSVRLPLDALSPFLVDLSPVVEAPSFDPAVKAGSFDCERDNGPVDWRTLFGNENPVEIEVGFGKGLFLLTAGSARPDTNFLGMEIERKYTLYTANRLAKRQLGNVRVCCGDARAIFEGRVPESTVQAVHVFFPDPWWKTKHRKRRLFTDAFAEACVRVLRPGGKLHLVSDVAEYFAEIIQLLGRQQGLQALPPPSPEQPTHDLDYLTNFERKYRQEGRAIHRALYEKVPEQPKC